MLSRRIIPCLDCGLAAPEGRVIKGVEFKRHKLAGSPPELAERYYQEGADEIVFLDITASLDRRETMSHVVEETSEKVFIPLTVGGGVGGLKEARELFNSGADKVTINTGALNSPDLINKLSKRFGSQACVVAIDAKRRSLDSSEDHQDRAIVKSPSGTFWYECSTYGGSKFTGRDSVKWAIEAEERGAGEILLTSMDRDGTTEGYDIPLIKKVSEEVDIPVIASGECGNPKHIHEVFEETEASAALAASIFHFETHSIGEVKRYLGERDIPARLETETL